MTDAHEGTPRAKPLLTLSRQGASRPPSAEEIERLRDLWMRDHYLHLPGLIDAALLARVRMRVESAEFFVKRHPDSGEELCMKSNEAVGVLDFLMNAPELTQTVEAVTGRGPIGSFFGRVYRLNPGTDQGHHWHDDNIGHRMLGVSVNLSDRPFEGGILQLRDTDTTKLLSEVANTGEGDCIVFELGPAVEHRVLPVTGSIARLAYAGWFLSEPSYVEMLKGPTD